MESSPPTPSSEDAPETELTDDGLAPGTLVADRYRLVARLGDGSMGTVYRAHQEALGRDVAVKFLHEEFMGNREVAARFAREAMAAARIEHPNVIAVYDSGTDADGRCFLAMEYIEGTLLRTVLEEARVLPHDRVLSISRQIAAALDHAHALGVVHRDIKPENVLLAPRPDGADQVKVIDFGVAKVLQPAGASNSALTRGGFVLGTPEYMAPEQAVGGEVDARADLYSLAVLAYEMLVGRRPFDDDDVMKVLMAHVHAPVPRASEHAPDVGHEVDAVFLHALAKSPGDRYPSAAAFVDDLARALRGTAPMHASTLPAPRPRSTTATGFVRARTDRMLRWWNERPARVRYALGVGAVALVFGAGALSNHRSVPTPTPVVLPERRAPLQGLAPTVGHENPADFAARVLVLQRTPGALSGSTRERQEAARALERLREHEGDDPAIAYVLGTIYARDRATWGLSISAYRDALRGAPSLASDATLLDDVTRAYLSSASVAVPAEALLRGPLSVQVTERLVAVVARGGTGHNRAATLLSDPVFHTRLDATQGALVALDMARTCEERRAVVVTIARSGDARALPALRRLPLDVRCGFLNLGSCGSCLRDAVPAAITAIEARTRDGG